jgi:hypothetical protein
MSSSVASCNTCTRRDCTRSANQGSGIVPGAIMLRAPVSSWRSIGLKAQDRSRSPRRREIIPQPHPSPSRAAARAAQLATSSMCASSIPNRCVDHDPLA